MKFSKSFIDLFIHYGEIVADIGNLSLDEALYHYHYTPLFPNFELARTLGQQDPIWLEYVAGLNTQPDASAWTYAFYERRYQPYVPQNPFGCFSYSVWTDNRIRLHFLSDPTVRCLRTSQQQDRLDELRSMFVDIRQRVDTPGNVVGGSWLYHIDAYRRLFPPAFLETATASAPEYPFMALWGQFLDYQGNTKEAMVSSFLDCLRQQPSLATIGECFPFSVLRLEAPVDVFYEFYGIA